MEVTTLPIDTSDSIQVGEAAGEAAAASRGDDEVLEGVTIGDAIEEVYSSEDEEEEGVVIHAGRTNTGQKRPQGRKSFGGKNMTYTRPDALSPHSLMSPNTTKGNVIANPNDTEEELKKLRFLRHATAFDVDINALEDHPWRSKTVDLLDYFNYGFNERTWLIYCEKQLRLRAQKGFGPVPLAVATPLTAPSIISGVVNIPSGHLTSAAFIPTTAFPVPVPVPAPTFSLPPAPQVPQVPPQAVPMPTAPSFTGAGTSFMPPPSAPSRPMPPGPPAAPVAPSSSAPPGGVPAPPTAPNKPNMYGMVPPPPRPAPFVPPPAASFNQMGRAPTVNMNMMMPGMEDMFMLQQQQQQQHFMANMGGVGPILDMYGREMGQSNGGAYGGPPGDIPPSDGYHDQRGGQDFDKEQQRNRQRDPREQSQRDPYQREPFKRDPYQQQQHQQHHLQQPRDFRDSREEEPGGKRKFAAAEEPEGQSKRRGGSNSRNRDRERDRDRDRGTSNNSARPAAPKMPAERAPASSYSDRRRDSRDREQSTTTSAQSTSSAPRPAAPAPRASSRDRRERDRDPQSRRDEATSSSGGRRGDREIDRGASDRRGRSPDPQKDQRDRGSSRERRPRR